MRNSQLNTMTKSKVKMRWWVMSKLSQKTLKLWKQNSLVRNIYLSVNWFRKDLRKWDQISTIDSNLQNWSRSKVEFHSLSIWLLLVRTQLSFPSNLMFIMILKERSHSIMSPEKMSWKACKFLCKQSCQSVDLMTSLQKCWSLTNTWARLRAASWNNNWRSRVSRIKDRLKRINNSIKH